MTGPIRHVLVIGIPFLVALLHSGAGHAQTVHHAEITARLERMQNLTVEYDEEIINTPPAWALDVPDARPPLERELFKGIFRFLDGRAWYETELSDETIEIVRREGTAAMRLYIAVFSHERVDVLFWQFGRDAARGTILEAGSLPLPRISTIDFALGLRVYEARENLWISPELLKTLAVREDDDGRVIVATERAEGRNHVWTFDPELGYALIRYVAVGTRGNPIRDFVAEDFREVEGLMLPYKITGRNLYTSDDEEEGVSRTVNLRIREYNLNDESNTPVSYQITWPAGTQVYDERVNLQMTVGDEPEVLDDDTIYQRLEERSEERERRLQDVQERLEEILSGPDDSTNDE